MGLLVKRGLMLSWQSKWALRPGSLLLALPVFASAWLLFAIEPMLAKLLLPSLGGSPATWAACMVAFQLLLLGGYAYAHLGARYLAVRSQAGLHAAVVLGAVAMLLGMGWAAPPQLGQLPSAVAVPWFVLRRVGAPYVVLASTAPLVARWARPLGRSGHALYAVSNAGALLGLLSYPLVLERFVALPVQLSLWAAGFVLLGLCLLPVCWVAGRAPLASALGPALVAAAEKKLYWLACAFLPSALLLAVTNYISVDVAATPLLWVAPLALYVASFVVAFGPLNPALRDAAVALWVVGALWLSLDAFAQAAVSLLNQVTPALLALTGASLFCHGELARGRPADDEPTGFFLIVASGGVLGGAFVSLLAPLVFSDFYELEVASMGIFGLLIWALARRDNGHFPRGTRWLVYLGWGLCVPLIGAEVWLRHGGGGRGGIVVERRRSFLGPLRVVDTAEGRVLTHGRIQHGMQLRAPAERRQATMYFGPGSGVERVLNGLRRERPRRLGVVGLGVGTLASYGRRGDALRFYELDPNVIELARRDFSFLDDSAANVSVVADDGRLALAREPRHAFDVLVLDAFSSDAVPVHLLTQQAFEVYARQLAPDGVLLANVSNRHLMVERVVHASARRAGFACVVVDTPASGSAGRGVHVVWAVMAREPAQLSRLVGDIARKPAGPEVLWTDSRASLLSILR